MSHSTKWLILVGLHWSASAIASPVLLDVVAGTATQKEPVDTGWIEGVTTPTVGWDSHRGEFVMLFASPVDVIGCHDASAIGFATSPDGAVWDLEEEQVVGPDASVPELECGASNPSLMIDDQSGEWSVWFNTIDALGVRHVGMTQFTRGFDDVTLLPELSGILEPSVAYANGEWLLVGIEAMTGGILGAHSNDGITWSVDVDLLADPLLEGVDGMYSPSLSCRERGSTWVLQYGSYTRTEITRRIARSADADTWMTSRTVEQWLPEEAPDSWDVLFAGHSTLMWTASVDADGVSDVTLTDDGAWHTGQLQARHCR